MAFQNEERAAERARMVTEQLAGRGIQSAAVLEAMRRIPRELFLPTGAQECAYVDAAVAIECGQTISQPYVVARMTELLELTPEARVLEIGTGSGYQAAILGMMTPRVITIERHPQLADQARALLSRLGYRNISVHCGDGTLGWPEEAPYPAIVVTAAAALLPQPLAEQLAPGGRLVLPVGDFTGQVLQVWTREKGGLAHENIIPVSFVPLRGKFGWSQGDWSRYGEETEY